MFHFFCEQTHIALAGLELVAWAKGASSQSVVLPASFVSGTRGAAIDPKGRRHLHRRTESEKGIAGLKRVNARASFHSSPFLAWEQTDANLITADSADKRDRNWARHG
jgi:hypothetical protein